MIEQKPESFWNCIQREHGQVAWTPKRHKRTTVWLDWDMRKYLHEHNTKM